MGQFLIPEEEWSTGEKKKFQSTLWDASSMKNTLDDAAKTIFVDGFKYKESHRLIDGRLAISLLACSCAAFALVWDYLNPFPQSRPVLIACVAAYYVVTCVLTAHMVWWEKNIFMRAYQTDPAGLDPDSVWTLSSNLPRYTTDYTITVQFKDGSTGSLNEVSITKPMSVWYDGTGLLLQSQYEPEIRKLHDQLISKKKD